MKNLLPLSIGLLICTSGFSQQQNVGIGTLSPAFKLDVRNGSINTDSVYRIGAITVLSVRGNGNLFVGKQAGRVNGGSENTFCGNQSGYQNNAGEFNSFFGLSAGYSNNYGNSNSFFGHKAGFYNEGDANSFFGLNSGFSNTSGSYNSFYGRAAGYSNTDGSTNSFFGLSSGYFNTEGSDNSFFGTYAGYSNETGNHNTAIGYSALWANIHGSNNTVVGHNANVGSPDFNLSNATAIGAGSQVDCSNCMVLGSSSVKVGIGVNAPIATLDVAGTGDYGTAAFRGTMNISHFNHGENEDTYIRAGKDYGNVILNDINGGKVGIGTYAPLVRLHVLDGPSGNFTPFGPLVVESENNTYINLLSPDGNETAVLFGKADNAASGGIVYNNTTTLNGFQFRTNGNTTRMKIYNNGGAWLQGTLEQTSDIRLKKDLHRLENSLQNITQLNGYHYHWVDPELNSGLQTGVIAQEVQKIFPDLVKEDAEGMLSVNYSGLIPVLIESIKEQQSQIHALLDSDKEQQAMIEQQNMKIEILITEITLIKANPK